MSKKRNSVALCLPYYRNPGMLERQCDDLAGLPEDLGREIELVVVDDGSPDDSRASTVMIQTAPMPLRAVSLYRITVDVRWNQDAARNLAVSQASSTWVLLTDIDHLVPVATWRRVIEGKLDPAKIYKFSRASLPSLAAYKPHPNSWLMTRELYDRMGGYDERFAGFYGTDGDFRDRCSGAATVELLPEQLWRVPREVIADASTTTYERKAPEDGPAIQRIKGERKLIPDWRPIRGRFPWVKVL